MIVKIGRVNDGAIVDVRFLDTRDHALQIAFHQGELKNLMDCIERGRGRAPRLAVFPSNFVTRYNAQAQQFASDGWAEHYPRSGMGGGILTEDRQIILPQ